MASWHVCSCYIPITPLFLIILQLLIKVKMENDCKNDDLSISKWPQMVGFIGVYQKNTRSLAIQGKLSVSKSGSWLKKLFHNLRKILAFQRKTVKITSFNLILLGLMHFFCVLWHFRHIFIHNFCWLAIFLLNENHFQKVWKS